jgi:TetR/AcrR family transcriptional regulator, transcriptional repressor for nem operon
VDYLVQTVIVVAVIQEPITERGRRSRERIVDAAAAAVAERGAGGCSLDQILEAAGASKSQLYHYFSDKSDLIRAVIARRVGDTVQCHGPLLGGIEGFADLRRWFDWLIDENEQRGCPGCPLGTLASELADCDEAFRADLAGGFDTWMSYVIDGLVRMQARGDLSDGADPERLGHAVFASLQGGLLLSKTYKDPKYLRDALDASYTHLLAFAPPGPVPNG